MDSLAEKTCNTRIYIVSAKVLHIQGDFCIAAELYHWHF